MMNHEEPIIRFTTITCIQYVQCPFQSIFRLEKNLGYILLLQSCQIIIYKTHFIGIGDFINLQNLPIPTYQYYYYYYIFSLCFFIQVDVTLVSLIYNTNWRQRS